MTRLWRGYTNMATTAGQEVVIARGLGSTVWDVDGNAYLDAAGSLWYCNVGHGRSEIREAVDAQMQSLAAFHTFDVFANVPALSLADELAGLTPIDDAAVFLTPGGGSDAVDTAAKLARRYWAAVGQPEKSVVVRRDHAYHGVNGYGTSLSGIPANQDGFGTLIPEVEGVVWDSADAVRDLFEASASRIAAFIGEPVIGAGGILPPPDGYWAAIAALCREYDVLLIADEVISGFGRLGAWFGSERYGFTPDMATCAKGLTSGYLPLGAVIASRRVRAPFWDSESAPPFRHGYTYGGHPTACAAALANIAIIKREELVERVAQLEEFFARTFRDAFSDCPLVGEVRTAGFLAGVRVDPAALAIEPTLPARIGVAARGHGVISRPLGAGMQVSPPLTTREKDLVEMAARLRGGFDSVLADDDVRRSLRDVVAVA
jgi:adenosylmethionine-8-amino-7-oxononanoate aminotransferase